MNEPCKGCPFLFDSPYREFPKNPLRIWLDATTGPGCRCHFTGGWCRGAINSEANQRDASFYPTCVATRVQFMKLNQRSRKRSQKGQIE